jgi:hypothetical protein
METKKLILETEDDELNRLEKFYESFLFGIQERRRAIERELKDV